MCNTKAQEAWEVRPFYQPKDHNSTTKFKSTETVQLLGEQFKSIPVTLTKDLKGNTNKQINEVRKSVQELEKNANNLDEKVIPQMRNSARKLIFGKSTVNRNVGKEKPIK